jgi:hypothetical protein
LLSVIRCFKTRCAIVSLARGDDTRTRFWHPLFRFQGASQRGHTSTNDGGVGPPWTGRLGLDPW